LITNLSERALILAPHGRDAGVAAAMLAEAQLENDRCRSIDDLVKKLDAGAGFAVVTEEALRTADLHPLARWIGSQPEWSDFPFILLTLRGGGLERNPAAARYLETLGNVTFLERPFHPTTLISLAQSASRARKRQYEARSRLAELRTLAADLELRVEERTGERQAALQQLHEAQKLETLGQLTGGVAHDFNNLLTPIVGALDLLRHKLTGQDARTDRWIGNALQSAERAKTLVQRLLGFARRQELQSSAVDVAALIEGMRDLIVSSVGPAIELTLKCPTGLACALADPNQLELAILNLTVNARDAMPHGGRLAITVEARKLDYRTAPKLPAGEYICVSVADTGIGMDADTLAHAVEPFFSTKDVGRGTGLGLSMVHGLAAQLGGAIALISTPGIGTSAEIYLPVTNQRSDDLPVKARGEVISSSRSLSVLLVDDEELVRSGTAEMLRHLGHRVAEAESGNQALLALAEDPSIEAVITDYRMPRMDGADLAQRIRMGRPGIPILLISGYTGSADAIEGLPRLNKPFGLGDLAEALDRFSSPGNREAANPIA
jgi:signal transduction histidine kinase/CheY-like chemotaxis protein